MIGEAQSKRDLVHTGTLQRPPGIRTALVTGLLQTIQTSAQIVGFALLLLGLGLRSGELGCKACQQQLANGANKEPKH